jgi:predicted nucleic acid-binding protein
LTVIIDASATLPWIFPDETTPDSRGLFERVLVGISHAPEFWLLEVTNALLNAERRGRISEQKLNDYIEEVLALPITLHPIAKGIQVDAIMQIARTTKLTIYDASYLELAVRLRLPLATRDMQLASAAKSLNVKLTAT